MSSTFRVALCTVALVVSVTASAVAQDAILASARQLRAAGENEAAASLLENAIERDGQGPALLGELGLAEVALERWAAATEHLRLALDSPGDPYVAQRLDELQRALATARGHLETAPNEPVAPPPGAGASGPVEDPFAADVDPDVAAAPLPQPAGEEPSDPTPVPPPSAVVPEALAGLLSSDSPPAAPLTRTEWYWPKRGMPLLGVFGSFGTRLHGSALSVSGSNLERIDNGDGRELAGSVGVELTLPLVDRLFASVRLFGGAGRLDQDREVRVTRGESIVGDPNFVYVEGYGSEYRGLETVGHFGLSLLGRYDLNKLVIGVGARLRVGTHRAKMASGRTFAFYRGSGCDLAREPYTGSFYPEFVGDYYGCSRAPLRLDDEQAAPYSDYRVWLVDLQAIVDFTFFLTQSRSLAAQVTLGFGKPSVSMSLSLVAYLGPQLGRDR